nr:reverse transcriptase domain-containing protein [Tanacetum cinerariifolium]
MTMNKVGDQTIRVIQRRRIDKEGNFSRFQEYHTSDEEKEELREHPPYNKYGFVDHPQLQMKDQRNNFTPYPLPPQEGNMNGRLTNNANNSDLESTTMTNNLNNGNGNGNGGGNNGCTYKGFVACGPRDFNRTGGAVALTRWIEKMEFARGQDAANAMAWDDFKTLLTMEFSLRTEIEKLEVRSGTLAKVGEKMKERDEASKSESAGKDEKKAKGGRGFVTAVPPRKENGNFPKDCRTPVRHAELIRVVRLRDRQRACYECSLRFALKLVAFCFKVRYVLLRSSLRFASRHVALCFKTSCVLSQDSCDLSYGCIAFCLLLKTLSAFWDVPNDVIKLMMFPYSLEGNPRVWLLSKTTREALQIIENKSKVCYSRNKPNVSRMNTTSRDNASKSDDRIDKLADQILTLVDIFAKKIVTPAPVKAVEESCVTCGGNHAYYNCPNTDSNQPSVCVATGTYYQVAHQNRASNYMAPPGFAPVQNNQNRFNQKQGQGNNFNRGNNFQPFQVPNQGFQNQPFQVLNNPVQHGFLNEFLSYKKVNDQMMRNMQNQINSLKGINPQLQVVERKTEETTDKEQTNFQGSTAHIQPLVTLIPEPDVPKTLPKPNIPYPSRLNDQKLHEKATNQMEKFFQIFQDLHFDISFADALLLMPKFASTIKSLLTKKDKLFELAKIPLNENCSMMLLKKLRDHGKFFIPCDFPRMDVCHALADLNASINLMPLSICKNLSLTKLTPTRMTLELTDRSITHPKRVAEDAFVKVGKFHFLTDFVVVNFEADPRVPLILGRLFLRIDRALIDVYREEITLHVNDEVVTFNLNQTTRYSSTYDDFLVNRIDIIDVAREEYAQEILGFSSNSLGGNPTSTFEPILSDSSHSLTPFEGSDFILEEIDAYLKDELVSPKIDHADCDPEGDICLIENLLNDEPF